LGYTAPYRTTFTKPYFFTLAMFLGEMLCLVWYYADRWWTNHRNKRLGRVQIHDNVALINGENTPSKPKPPLWVFLLLSTFDLSATAVNGVGLVWVDASVTQMLRGSGVVFTAFFSIMLLRRRLGIKQWFGIAIVCVGLLVVGVSSYLSEVIHPQDNSNGSAITPFEVVVGVLLILLGSALNAIQGVFEEKIMKAVGGADVPPLELVGWEGVFGTLLSVFVMLPIVHFLPGPNCGSQENIWDTLYMLQNPFVSGIVLAFILGLCVMNYLSQEISKVLTAVHRQLISTLRTVLVWIAEILFWYVILPGKNFGENWDWPSFVQLAGFICLVIGTFVYGRAKEAEAAEHAPAADPDK